MDNQYNVVWEVKSNDSASVHWKDRTYRWGGKGKYPSHVDEATVKHNEWNPLVDSANAGLCGYTDWIVEPDGDIILNFLVQTGTSPTINTHYFPNTVADKYWFYAESPDLAAFVNFNNNDRDLSSKSNRYRVRLLYVR